MTKKNIVRVVGLAGLFLVCSSSYASGMYVADNAYSKEGFLIGGDIGMANPNTSREQLFDPADISGSEYNKTHPLGWGVHAGYNKGFLQDFLLGLEVGYKNYGQSNYYAEVDSSDTIPTGKWRREILQQSLDAFGTATYFFTTGLNVFGKLGVALVRVDTDQNLDGDSNFDERVHGFRPEMQFGIGYMFKNKINLYVAYDHLFGDNSEEFDRYSDDSYTPISKIYAVDEIVFGIAYTF